MLGGQNSVPQNSGNNLKAGSWPFWNYTIWYIANAPAYSTDDYSQGFPEVDPVNSSSQESKFVGEYMWICSLMAHWVYMKSV